jgi:hypothetical protein
MSFAPHLWNFLSTDCIEAKAAFFHPIHSATANRKEITQLAHQLITEEYFTAA